MTFWNLEFEYWNLIRGLPAVFLTAVPPANRKSTPPYSRCDFFIFFRSFEQVRLLWPFGIWNLIIGIYLKDYLRCSSLQSLLQIENPHLLTVGVIFSFSCEASNKFGFYDLLEFGI